MWAHLKRPWCWERLRAGGEGHDRGWDSWMALPTQRTWVLMDSGSWLMDREAWRAADHGVTKSWTWLRDWTELNSLQNKGNWHYLLTSGAYESRDWSFFFFSLFFEDPGLQDLNSLTRDWTHDPLQWKCKLLITRLPGKSPGLWFLIISLKIKEHLSRGRRLFLKAPTSVLITHCSMERWLSILSMNIRLFP